MQVYHTFMNFKMERGDWNDSGLFGDDGAFSVQYTYLVLVEMPFIYISCQLSPCLTMHMLRAGIKPLQSGV
jgi:hypothetical protein